MDDTVPAIFDSGVFRPLEPVDLAQGTQVQVHLPHHPAVTVPELPLEELARQQAAIEVMLAEIESLPTEEAEDDFSGRDHDQVLYGGR